MTDIPIIFSAPMIQALLAGRKTMTRRLAYRDGTEHYDPKANKVVWPESPWLRVKAGDRLWVRETWQKHHSYATLEDAKRAGPLMGALYRADHGEFNLPVRWRSPIHMPRVHSRLTLIITATKIEWLHDISDADAKAEGVQHRWLKSAACAPRSLYFIENGEREHSGTSAQAAFEMLWCSLHGPDAWLRNPEVAALTFTVHKRNIDAMKEAA